MFVLQSAKRVLGLASRKQTALKNACTELIAEVEAQQSRNLPVPHTEDGENLFVLDDEDDAAILRLFLPFVLGLDSHNARIVDVCLGCLQKLISYGFVRGAVPANIYTPHLTASAPSTPTQQANPHELKPHIDVLVHMVCRCFEEVPDESVQVSILNVLLTAVSTPTYPAHDSALINAVRTCYNIHLVSRNLENQRLAKQALTQIVTTVLERTEEEGRNADQKNTAADGTSPSETPPTTPKQSTTTANNPPAMSLPAPAASATATTAATTTKPRSATPTELEHTNSTSHSHHHHHHKLSIGKFAAHVDIMEESENVDAGGDGKDNTNDNNNSNDGGGPAETSPTIRKRSFSLSKPRTQDQPPSAQSTTTAVVRGTLTLHGATHDTFDEALIQHLRKMIANSAGCSEDRVKILANPPASTVGNTTTDDDDDTDAMVIVRFVVSTDSIDHAGDALERLLEAASLEGRFLPTPQLLRGNSNTNQNNGAVPPLPLPSRRATSPGALTSARANHEPRPIPRDYDPSKHSQPFRRDAWLLFRSLCKLSTRQNKNGGDGSGGNTFAATDATLEVKSMVLNLELLLTLLHTAGPTFCSFDRFLQGARTSLVSSLLHNAASPNITVFALSVEVFSVVLERFRDKLKCEIEVFFKEMFLRILDSPNAQFDQRLCILQAIAQHMAQPQLVLDLFLNYDCDLESVDIFERIVTVCSKYARTNHCHEFGYTALQDQKLRAMGFRALVAVVKSLREWLQLTENRPTTTTQTESTPKKAPASVSEEQNTHVGSVDEASGTDGTANAQSSYKDDGSVSDEVERGASASMAVLMSKERKLERQRAVEKFNKGAKDAVSAIVATGFAVNTPESFAAFLRSTPGLDKTMIGEFIGRNKEFNLSVMHRYVESFNFEGLSFVNGLRTFLGSFWLPGEAQVVDRIMEKFGSVFHAQNPGVFNSPDAAFVLAFSTIMLNTDLHSPHIKNKMTRAQYISNNRGINRTVDGDPCDLDPAFLNSVFDDIQAQQIKITQELGGSTVGGLTAHDMASGNLKQRQALFERETADMVTRSQEIIRKLNKDRRHLGSNDSFVVADDVEHVGPMFGICWHPMLASFALTLEHTDDPELVELALNGFKDAICISARFYLTTERTAFVSSLGKFTFLHSLRELKLKNILAIKALINIAYTNGNFLQESWHDVLSTVSQVQKLYLLFAGAQADCAFLESDPTPLATPTSPSTSLNLLPAPFIGLMRSRPSSTAVKSGPNTSDENTNTTDSAAAVNKFGRSIKGLSVAGLNMVTMLSGLSGKQTDSSSTIGGAASGGGGGSSRAVEDRIVEEHNAAWIGEHISSADIDALFASSQGLSNDAIEYFVQALCLVSQDELSAAQPRIFCLQKIVETAYFNMDRIRIVWRRIWEVLGQHFIHAACQANQRMAMYAVDSLRQLAMKFLEKDELGSFQFQKEFLKPFEVVMQENTDHDIRELVLGCVKNIVQARYDCLKSGWKTVFCVCTLAASDDVPNIVTLGFDVVTCVMGDHFDRTHDYFVDCVNCLVAFAGNRVTNQTLSLKAIEYVRFCGDQLAEGKVGDLLNIDATRRLLTVSTTSAGGDSVEHTNLDSHAFSDDSGSVGRMSPPPPSLLSIARTSDNQVARGGVESGGGDPLVRPWFPIFTGLSRLVVTDPRLSVRSGALQALFDVLTQHGGAFTTQFWGMTFRGVLFPIFDDVEYVGVNVRAMQERDREWLQTTCLSALRSLVGLMNTFFSSLAFMLPELLSLLSKCIHQVSEGLARVGFACIADLVTNSGPNFSSEMWTMLCSCLEALFEQSLPFHRRPKRANDQENGDDADDAAAKAVSNDEPPPLNLPQSDTTATTNQVFVPQPRTEIVGSPHMSTQFASPRMVRGASAADIDENEFDRIRCRCLVQLELIQLVGDTLTAFASCMDSTQVAHLLDLLEQSFDYASDFNTDVAFRVALQRAGLLRNHPNQLPSLLKQEVNALSTYIRVCQRVALESAETAHPYAASAEARLLSVCEACIVTFVSKEAVVASVPCAEGDIVHAEQYRELTAWIPVVNMIIRMFDDFDAIRMAKHLPRFLRHFFSLVACESRELREELRTFLLKYHDQAMAIHLTAVSALMSSSPSRDAVLDSVNTASSVLVRRNSDIAATAAELATASSRMSATPLSSMEGAPSPRWPLTPSLNAARQTPISVDGVVVPLTMPESVIGSRSRVLPDAPQMPDPLGLDGASRAAVVQNKHPARHQQQHGLFAEPKAVAVATGAADNGDSSLDSVPAVEDAAIADDSAPQQTINIRDSADGEDELVVLKQLSSAPANEDDLLSTATVLNTFVSTPMHTPMNTPMHTNADDGDTIVAPSKLDISAETIDTTPQPQTAEPVMLDSNTEQTTTSVGGDFEVVNVELSSVDADNNHNVMQTD